MDPDCVDGFRPKFTHKNILVKIGLVIFPQFCLDTTTHTHTQAYTLTETKTPHAIIYNSVHSRVRFCVIPPILITLAHYFYLSGGELPHVLSIWPLFLPPLRFKLLYIILLCKLFVTILLSLCSDLPGNVDTLWWKKNQYLCIQCIVSVWCLSCWYS